MDMNAMDILCCLITIGDPDPDNPMLIKNPIEIREVEELEITESYKELIGTATLKFPKGTVYQNTIIVTGTTEGIDATRVTTEIMQDGVIIEKRSSQNTIEEKTFKIGNRINIKIGYNGFLKNMFDGYITSYNSDSNVEIGCENMAYKLKLKQAPKFETPVSGTKVNDVLGEKYNLLKDTGFEIHSETKKFDIQIGKVKVTDNFTVADILSEWSKFKVFCFLKYDADSPSSVPSIAIGRPYSSSKSQPVFPTDISGPFEVHYNYHVATSDLKVVKTDPKFLAVTGKALGTDEKFFEVTVRLNPEYDEKDKNSKEFQVVNATQVSKKSHKVTGNVTASGAKTKTKVDLSTYTIVPYMSPNMKINSDTLVEETIEYFRNYNLNGITGSVTIFGDYGLTTAVQVELIDNRNPSKNGVYLVEEVVTTFGINGYRQKMKLPYKIKGEMKTYGGQEKNK
jgi:hypothetical protein